MKRIKLKSPAKINLFLEITGKRKDGYHDLITVFAKINIFDYVSMEKTAIEGIKVSMKNNSNLRLKKSGDNIIHKTALRFFEEFKIKPNVKIKLEKNIPVGAGLGGGSANSAVVLSGLCRMYGIDLKTNRKKMSLIAKSLGADVPFFLSEASFCVGRGIGDKLFPFKVKKKRYSIVLVYPGIPVSTKAAYSNLKLPGKKEAALNNLKCRKLVCGLKAGKDMGKIRDLPMNRFEKAIFPKYGGIKKAKEKIISLGADMAMMSGSGSSVFGVFSSDIAAKKAAKQIASGKNRVFLTNFL
ncbi:MAG: 4-(cytidine 5'-diphospho)-2-C-methyl-D-erythritol kinase [Elusimicrobiales bacterium]|nr:4-(cytidine 5'-diphospho)-2-C-methyl-D-erythritol kinase [Elusimicrobiales bacterium]